MFDLTTRDLISRMADELDRVGQMLADDRTARHSLATEARAALARWGHPAAPPVEGEVAELVEWLALVSKQFRIANLEQEAVWTDRAAALLQQQQPVPPAAGEVGELVKWLRSLDWQSVWFEEGSLEQRNLLLAAALLSRQAPQPVPPAALDPHAAYPGAPPWARARPAVIASQPPAEGEAAERDSKWPQYGPHRAFVAGAKWWQYTDNGAMACGGTFMRPADVSRAEEEAVKRWRSGGWWGSTYLASPHPATPGEAW